MIHKKVESGDKRVYRMCIRLKVYNVIITNTIYL